MWPTSDSNKADCPGETPPQFRSSPESFGSISSRAPSSKAVPASDLEYYKSRVLRKKTFASLEKSRGKPGVLNKRRAQACHRPLCEARLWPMLVSKGACYYGSGNYSWYQGQKWPQCHPHFSQSSSVQIASALSILLLGRLTPSALLSDDASPSAFFCVSI